jgi:hypothetical protein
MPKAPISVTLERDNLLWLRSQATAAKYRSVSDALDQIVTEARLAGRASDEGVRSVVGSIDIDDGDPLLSGADEYVRGLFDESLRRPWLVRDAPPRARRRDRKEPRRG